MTRFDSWESYLYPPPDDRTLRNLFDERDPHVLRRLEYDSTRDRQRELRLGLVEVPRTYDAAHVRAIHRHLFQDVYEWAGEYRTVNMFKGTPRGFADVSAGEIDRYLADVQRLVEAAPWDRLGREEFADRAATVFAYLNQAHPFREGNGRTSKVFMEHVAERSRFQLDYSRVSPEQWNEASKLSGPDLMQYEPVPDSLVPVFRHMAVERTSTSIPSANPTGHERSALSASYPRSATETTRSGSEPPEAGRYMPGRGYGSAEREEGR